jgi:hypothetical protein
MENVRTDVLRDSHACGPLGNYLGTPVGMYFTFKITVLTAIH